MDTLSNQFIVYVALLGVIALVGAVNKSPFPTSLLLVIVGMAFSFIPGFPHVQIHSELILNIFLPLLLYQAGAYASWRDFRKNIRPIAYLSIGHVIFITLMVALTIHFLIPQISWPLAFVLGAVISPPDDVAIMAIADKINFPSRIMTILTGESLLNDATALIIFRFALAAVITHAFSPTQAVMAFFIIVTGETLYGLALGHIMGQLRLHIKDPILQITLSLVIPFLAFLVPEKLGGSGVISTVVTGIVIGTSYLRRYSPEVRLSTRSVWTTLGYILQNLLFILIGLDMRYILQRISLIPTTTLLLYSSCVILVVIIGRFIWIFGTTYLTAYLFPKIRKKDPPPPWQYLFIGSWAGMRGGISLAAALAIPELSTTIDLVDPRDLLVFLVFSVIAATLLFQGMTLPWLMKVLGVSEFGRREKYRYHLDEMHARERMFIEVLKWLKQYKTICKENDRKLYELVQLHIHEFETLLDHLKSLIEKHDDKGLTHDTESELQTSIRLSLEIIEVERETILHLWNENKINHAIRNKLTRQLDHQESQLTDYL